MFKPSLRILPITAALTFVASAAMAQGTTQDTASPATSATTIGVTPQDAQEALKKASPNADTGTLVRTEPSAGKRARTQAKDAKNSTHPSPTKTPKLSTPKVSKQQPANTTPRPAGVPSNKTTGTVTNTTTPSMAMGITGTVPGADATTGDATNTRDNAHKGQGSTSGEPNTTQPTDAMGNRGSNMPNKSSKP